MVNIGDSTATNRQWDILGKFQSSSLLSLTLGNILKFKDLKLDTPEPHAISQYFDDLYAFKKLFFLTWGSFYPLQIAL